MIEAAIVGLGGWGRTILRELAGSSAIKIVLGIDPEPGAREAATASGLAVSPRFDEVLQRSDVKAVILCSPHKYHAGQIVAAAKAGKHVFCEKPLCTSAREMEQVAAAVKAAGVQLGIGHERRFEPGVIELMAAACGRRARNGA